MKNNSWSDDYILRVEHLSREQMREVQIMLENQGWKTRVSKA